MSYSSSHFVDKNPFKMKLVAVTLLALIAAVAAGPINVSDNNVGDIVSVGINANLEISNQIEQNIISIIVALLTDQDLNINLPEGWPSAPNLRNVSPEMIERVRELISRK